MRCDARRSKRVEDAHKLQQAFCVYIELCLHRITLRLLRSTLKVVQSERIGVRQFFMRIIILNQFFYPDHSVISQLMTELAESLIRNGIEVAAFAIGSVITLVISSRRAQRYSSVSIEFI